MGFRAWLVAAALLFNAIAQQPTTLRIRITIVDADQQTRPVPRHGLLISENPTSAAPQLAVTALDGSAEIRLRPGNYTIESDQPLIFQGKSYEWTQTIDVRAGQATTLELNAANAQVEAAGARPASASAAVGETSNASALLLDWQNSVVAIWSPTKRGAGFLIDARGLIATNQRLVGIAKTLEVQLSPTVKVAARVLVVGSRQERRDSLDRSEGRRLGASDETADPRAPGSRGGEREALHHQLAGRRREEPGVRDGEADNRAHDPRRHPGGRRGASGAPLFNAAGDVIAITTPHDEPASATSDDIRAVRIDDALRRDRGRGKEDGADGRAGRLRGCRSSASRCFRTIR